MTDLSELVVRIRADASGLQTEMKSAEGQVTQSASAMEKAFGAVTDAVRELLPVLSAAAFVEFGKQAVESAIQMDNLSNRIGFSASTLSILEPQLLRTGTSLESFAAAVNLMNARIGLAVDGNKQAILTFEALGLSVEKLKTMTPEEQFYAIAKAISELGSQFEQSEQGRAIFGRGFAQLLPMIKEANGDIQDSVDKLKAMDEGLSDEKIKRIHEFGDALEDAGVRAKNAFLGAFAALLQYTDEVEKRRGSILPGPAGSASNALQQLWSIHEMNGQISRGSDIEEYDKKAKSLGYVTEATVLNKPQQSAADAAKGSNAALLASLGKSTDDSLPDDQDQSKLQQYITNLQNEADAIKLSSTALAEQKTIIEATKKAQDDYDDGLRDSPLLYEGEIKAITQSTDALIDFKKQQDEATKLATKMKEQFASSLADIAVNFKGMGDTVKKVIDDIAKEIIQAKITQPLSNAVVDSLGGKGSGDILSSIGTWLGSLLPKFAAGGDPAPGMPSIVGENGPEIFVPRTAGTVIPNGSYGGNQVTVVQQFNMSPGLAGTVEAEVRRAAPYIAAQTHAMVFDSIARGGKESRLVGKRH